MSTAIGHITTLSKQASARIGLEVTAAVRQGGGIGRYVRQLLQATAQRDDGFDYRLFYASENPIPHQLPPLAPNFRVRQLPFHDIWLARGWHRLQLPVPVTLITGKVDLYHSPDFTLPPTPNIPTVLTVHDLSFVRDPESAAPGLRAYLNTVVPRSVKRATHILADSQATKDDLIDLYNTPADKITVLYCGVGPEFAPVTDAARLAAVRATYGIGAQPYIFSISTLQPRKNYQRLIQAFDAAMQTLQDQDTKLVLAGGKGWLYDEIFAEVERRNLQARVIFPGFVADEDLAALYSGAEVMAYPSLYEGFGLPMLEAMACGTPVLTSTESCLPEVAADAAVCVDPYDVDAIAQGLVQVLQDSSTQQTLVTKGYARAREFTWQQSAQVLTDVYRMLL